MYNTYEITARPDATWLITCNSAMIKPDPGYEGLIVTDANTMSAIEDYIIDRMDGGTLLIQDACPMLSATEREYIRIGLSPAQQSNIFGD